MAEEKLILLKGNNCKRLNLREIKKDAFFLIYFSFLNVYYSFNDCIKLCQKYVLTLEQYLLY